MNASRIMVVEDERIVAFDLQHTLESFGHEVVAVVASGEHAIERAAQLQPDLVLMDINLEGQIDGTEAARSIHAQHGVPVVFLTAYAEQGILERAEASAPYGYLLKPVETRALQASLRMALARRRAEQCMQRGEERLRLALDAANLCIWEWDAVESRFHSEGGMERLLGGVPRALVGGSDALLQRIDPTEQDIIAGALARGEPVQRTVRIAPDKADGRPVWVDFLARSFIGGEGVLKRAVGVIRDATERHEQEEALRQASLAFESTAEGIAILDDCHRVVTINAAFTRITGYPLDEIRGRDPEQLLLGRRHDDAIFGELGRHGSDRWHGEIAARRRDGDRIHAWLHACVLRSAAGEVTNYLIALSDITVLRQTEALVQHQAFHDALTGLGNRNMLGLVLDREIERRRANGSRFALLFIDLDGFKLINDTLGHDAGDKLLIEVSQRIARVLRSTDTCVRLGGDEFLVVAPSIGSAHDGVVLADKLLGEIRAVVDLGNERLRISASIGIALCPDHAETPADLVKAADNAMYGAKENGRNRAVLYSADMAARVADRLKLEQGLMRAIGNDELFLEYQPVVDIRSGRIIGAEALMRWQDPVEGRITPARFIPVAEECGLIDILGTWALRTACREAHGWIDDRGVPLRLAVNVSVRQFRSGEFPQVVERVLAETGFPAERLELEITESTLQQVEESREQIAALTQRGILISVDDFGTGYSSLSVLKHLAIKRIKIDRSFVTDLPGDPSDVGITEAIIALATALNLSLTAEGVETIEQSRFLAERCAMDAQGFLYHRPLAAAEIEALIRPDTTRKKSADRPPRARRRRRSR
ncbi:MAG: EAL domain-containing protein [Rhodocyclaceae bacterium]|nr:EAL domain-containing protein [Rhodocyclaceae bacterium]